MMKPLNVLTPTGCLGYGFDQNDFERCLNLGCDVIAVDAGSTDPGPYYLGAGISYVPRIAIKRELEILVSAAVSKRIPLIVGSSGGSGGNPHLEWTVDIVEQIAREQKCHFRMATIKGEIEKSVIKEELRRNNIKDFEAGYDLGIKDVEDSVRIVAQMGPEPIIAALQKGAQIIIAGRSCDDGVIAAYPIWKGFDPGLSIHMGKVLECGALAAVPIGMDVMMGTIYDDYFVLEPGSLERKCTVTSVTGHSLYERDNPFTQPGPGGYLDTKDCRIEQLDERRVKVSKSRFVTSKEYHIKLEGVKRAGYRTISIAGIRCPTMIERIDPILDVVRKKVQDYFSGMGDYYLGYHLYGKDGVMGALEVQKKIISHELGMVVEVIAATQELANAICHITTGTILHQSYDGQKNNAGNLAFLYSPSEIDVGEVFLFSVYHLLKVKDPCSFFPIELKEV